MEMSIEREKLLGMFRTMVRIRAFEERLCKDCEGKAYPNREKLPGFVHLSTGQEAIPTGVCANLRRDDYIISTHRGHGELIAKGGKTDRMMAELYGKRTGYSRGKGGSMHLADMAIGMLGANGVVGAGIPIAGGAALSAKLRGTDQVSVCFFGDGATGTGRFHESINMASVWKLPVIYVLENNLYFVNTRTSDHVNITNLADRACAYGIPGVIVDGNDVIAVYQAANDAVARARKGEGPTLIECKTYKWHEHFEGMPKSYRPKEEVKEWMTKDPVPRFRKQLIGMNILTETEAGEIEQQMAVEMDKAVKFAEESPFPDLEETLEDVFV